MDQVITGNHFDKYGSRNPAVRWIVGQYLAVLYDLIERAPFSSVLEAGCGEGEIVRRISARYAPAALTAFDIDPFLIERLRSELPEYRFEQASLTDYRTAAHYDLVLCLEVLEHIADYREALSRLSAIPADRLILSVPREPWFRLANVSRLKYLTRLGNTPGHVNNFSLREFRSLISSAFPRARIEFRTCWIWSFAHVLPA